MNTEKTNTSSAETKPPDIVKRIGNTTYMINVYFSTTSKETMNDKIMRLIKNDAAETQ